MPLTNHGTYVKPEPVRLGEFVDWLHSREIDALEGLEYCHEPDLDVEQLIARYRKVRDK